MQRGRVYRLHGHMERFKKKNQKNKRGKLIEVKKLKKMKKMMVMLMTVGKTLVKIEICCDCLRYQ